MPNLPNGFGQVTFRWRYVPYTRDMSVTLGFYDSIATNDPTLIATNMRTFMGSTGRPQEVANMSTDWQNIGTTVLLRSSGGVLMSGVDATVTTGTASAATATQPLFVPMVVSKLTSFAGKHYRGRMYVPCTLFGESSVDIGGTITGGNVGLQQTRWDNFFAAINASVWPPFLLHQPVGVVPLPTAITSFLVRPVTGVQRRRRTRGA